MKNGKIFVRQLTEFGFEWVSALNVSWGPRWNVVEITDAARRHAEEYMACDEIVGPVRLP